jgi:hypothetical protein
MREDENSNLAGAPIFVVEKWAGVRESKCDRPRLDRGGYTSVSKANQTGIPWNGNPKAEAGEEPRTVQPGYL